MSSVYARGKKLWFRVKVGGAWTSKPTPFAVGDETKAERYAVAAQAAVDKREAAAAAPGGPRTVATYAVQWTAERVARGVANAEQDLSRLQTYAFPIVGDLLLTEVRPHHARDVVRALRTAGELAPRTIISIHRTLRSMFESAIVDELVESNPIKVKPGELPKKRDKDPTWRSRATYTVHEVERLIFDPAIPVERRVQYAIKALAGMRHGEVAALTWRAIDYTAEPLARINVTLSWCSKTHRVKSTKTGDARAVPMHPTLAKILAAWKLSHWERIYGRRPTAEDLVVPTRNGTHVNASDAVHAFKADLAELELRIEAGEHRDRGGHDLRGFYKTRAIEDGADSLIIRRTTHATPDDVNSGYERFSWSTVCREVSKIRVGTLDGEVLPLATGFATAELNHSKRWRKQATPTGSDAFETGRLCIPLKFLTLPSIRS